VGRGRGGICGPHKGDTLVPGQVLLFRMRQGAVAKHLGIVSSRGGRARLYPCHTPATAW